jgi:ParB-like chromosome segregation protein Spo0J
MRVAHGMSVAACRLNKDNGQGEKVKNDAATADMFAGDVELIVAAVQALAGLPLDQRVSAINDVRAALHAISPFQSEPVDFVRWVKAENVHANDYNPNSVAPPEMALLRQSISADGYTQPIVAMLDDSGTHEVIDGFHRHRVGKECADIQSRVHGYLPLVQIRGDRTDKPDRMAATIRHNRARGEHRVDQMAEIVIELKRRFWSDEKISKELGMDADEVLRLTQVTGLSGLFADRDFSEAWEAETLQEVEGADELDA